jgi:REP element-mobilizing transposase RayT
MTRPLRIQFDGAFYHVTSRGNERRNVFRNNRDREQFLSYLKSAHYRYKAVFHVFCLMNNHYHFLLETPKGNLSQIMHHINGAYTNYFNIKHRRRGHLFQGRYKAIIVDTDSYAGELSRYIHLNPVRAGLIDVPEKYKWSSYCFYIGRNKRPEWFSTGFILSYFEGERALPEKRYQNFVNAKMHMRYVSPMKEAAAATILGSEDFIEMIRDKYVNGKKTDRELPAIG